MSTHSAEYWHLQLALAASAKSLDALEADLATFEPLPPSAFAERENARYAELRVLNPGKSEADFDLFFEKAIRSLRSPEMQRINEFHPRAAAQHVTTITLAAALCEGLINAILVIGLAHSRTAALFEVLEKASPTNKWLLAPKAFLPGYELSKTEAKEEALRTLFKRRDAIMHAKISYTDDDGKVLTKGSDIGNLGFDAAALSLLRRYLALPYKLHQQLCAQVTDSQLRFTLEHLLGFPV